MLIIIYLILNLSITIGIFSQGEIIPKKTKKVGKLFYFLMLISLGLIINLFIIISFACKPIVIYWKIKKRNKKISKKLLARLREETPPDIFIDIY